MPSPFILCFFVSFLRKYHRRFYQAWAEMLYLNSYIVQYVKFWDERRMSMNRRTRVQVVPEEIEDLHRQEVDLVLEVATAASSMEQFDSRVEEFAVEVFKRFQRRGDPSYPPRWPEADPDQAGARD